jgi:signal transduction histidine kinase
VRELVRKNDMPRAPADLNRLVRAALEVIAPSARQRSIVVRFDAAVGLPAVEVEGIQIEQVVVNLLLNALEAIAVSEPSGEIDVCTSAAEAGGVEVSVRDSGGGFDPVTGTKIFEPFFTTKPDGLGMGLAISRSIVEAHGGRLWVTTNETVGTTFRFTLPAPEDA